jgi:hypothetical protein
VLLWNWIVLSCSFLQSWSSSFVSVAVGCFAASSETRKGRFVVVLVCVMGLGCDVSYDFDGCFPGGRVAE